MTSQPTSTRNGRQTGVRLAPAWWAFGLALHERLPVDQGVAGHPADGRALGRLAAWRADFGSGDRFGRRLADGGLDEPALLALLAEPADSLAARAARPAWVDTVERAVRAAEPLPADVCVDAARWRTAFALPVRPFVTTAAGQLRRQAHVLLDPRLADLDAIAAEFSAGLSHRLVRIATRTLVHEYNVQRAAGRGFADFVRRLTEPAGLAELITGYPVLARLLGQASLLAVESVVELLARFAADRAAIVDTLLAGADPGRLTSVATGAGDAHRRGRSVATLTFAGGQRVVYKPRDLAAHELFAAALDWLNRAVPELGLRIPASVGRSGYGWQEFVPAEPVANLAAAGRFYRRQGALLALLHAVHASDVHCENMIACGDQPVLVDTETLFHPALGAPAGPVDPAARVLAASVQRIGLLPMIVVGETGPMDMSGLGGDRGQVSPSTMADWEPGESGELRMVRRTYEFSGALNRPRLGGTELDAADHERALVDGFRLGYDAIMRHREELATFVESCADVEVRVVVRHTRGYARLLTESTRPELLRDALDRDRALDLLWTESTDDSLHWRVCRYEQADLWLLDIPLFSARAGATDLSTSDGRRLPGLLVEPGLAGARNKIQAMSELDRYDQEWIISAGMAIRRAAPVHNSTEPMPGQLSGTAAPPERLLVAACALADRIVARGLAEGDRVNWLGLELVDDQRWLMLPMGAGLANGYTGVALFLAQLADLTGIARYGDAARRAVRAIPQLYDRLSGRPDLVAAIGCGGLHGFGGIAYALARLSTLLVDEELRGWARTAVRLAEIAARQSGSPAFSTGDAGCLAAMSAVHAELRLDEAARLAGSCADRLADLVLRPPTEADRPPSPHRIAGLPAGFAEGVAGVGWALARFAAGGGSDRHARAADLALRQTPTPAQVAGTDLGSCGWCCGAAGVAIARTALAERGVEGTGMTGVVRLLADRAVLRDLSLCHGELGITEALTVLAADGDNETAVNARRRRVGLIVDAINQVGTPCGAPGGMSTPGLLTGLAGIGYGLLRLGFADRVPSVLFLDSR